MFGWIPTKLSLFFSSFLVSLDLPFCLSFKHTFLKIKLVLSRITDRIKSSTLKIDWMYFWIWTICEIKDKTVLTLPHFALCALHQRKKSICAILLSGLTVNANELIKGFSKTKKKTYLVCNVLNRKFKLLAYRVRSGTSLCKFYSRNMFYWHGNGIRQIKNCYCWTLKSIRRYSNARISVS